ncbi:interleukin-1 receptor type 1 isoform X3 [Ranitomeya imitator]|uniref:interleukin-1 receptor type 1 isoform X3 n=1 Tax=Ranitomeya imitator TaxID=111125 RepID=UPI0037E7C308
MGRSIETPWLGLLAVPGLAAAHTGHTSPTYTADWASQCFRAGDEELLKIFIPPRVHKMSGYLLGFTLCILTLIRLPFGKAESCIDYGVEFDIEYASVGEPLYAACPLYFLFEENNFNVTWIRNDSLTEITSDRQARVHQDENYLKFIPVDLQDNGFYQCIFRNSTFCMKKIRRIEVFNNDDGLCYKYSVMFPQDIILAPSHTIECPNLDIYVNYENVKVKWFKECQPLHLDGKRYSAFGNTLTIENLSVHDSGNYTCEVPFTYRGVTYNLSRAISCTITDTPKEIEPVMLFPTNTIIDVELGAAIELTCKVLYNKNLFLYWAFNDTFMDYYAENDRVKVGTTDEISTENETQYLKTMNFTKVVEEDYNRQFYCHGISSKLNIFFYVTFKRPDPNFQGFLIAFFVSLFFVIVIAIIAIRIFKVDIVLWYRGSCFAKTDQKDADGKQYDAYIIYPKNSTGTNSCEMDIFVLKVLPEVLEKQCSYRLFIIGRDDLPGQAMADLVDETISQSRRVIIVLGNVFCEKHGEDFEQKIAMYDALIRNKVKVILIEMQKITDYTNMPESIKYIKQKQGVVRWKGGLTEAALSPSSRFWKNIRYQMPLAPRHSEKELHYIHSED